MKRALILYAVIGFSAARIFAQTGTFNFLRTDVSARSAGMNGSFVSMKDDPNVIFYNPASIGTLTSSKVSFSYLKHLMDVNAGSFSYVKYIEGTGNVGMGITYINYGSFNRTDDALNILGTFGSQELAILAGVAAHYDDDILVGINAKYIFSSIAEYSSYALAVDLGFIYDIPSENLTIGGSILNLGTQFRTYDGFDESLPLDVKVGITKRPQHLPILLNIDFHRLNEKGNTFLDRFSNFTIGAEILMSESFRLRVGYNNKQRKDLKMGTSSGLAGFAMGGGLLLHDYQVDYSFNSYGKIGGLHRISLGINL
jgi:hypothetical protein